MRWDISPRWDVSPEWDTFHSTLIWEKYPTWVRHFSSHLDCVPTFKQLCYFHCLLIFSFLFQFRITHKIFDCKFYKMSPVKTLYTEENHPTSKWDLIYVEVNQFSYKRFVFTKRNIPFCRDLTQVRRLKIIFHI